MSGEIVYRDEVYKIIGAAIEVHKILGPGFLEAVYQEALEIELGMGNIDRKEYMSGIEEILAG